MIIAFGITDTTRDRLLRLFAVPHGVEPSPAICTTTPPIAHSRARATD